MGFQLKIKVLLGDKRQETVIEEGGTGKNNFNASNPKVGDSNPSGRDSFSLKINNLEQLSFRKYIKQFFSTIDSTAFTTRHFFKNSKFHKTLY